MREGGERGEEEKEGRRRKRGGGRFSYKFMLLRYVELSLASLIPRQTTALCTTAFAIWLDGMILALATSGRKTVDHVSQSQIRILNSDWIVRFSLLQPDVARPSKSAVQQ